MDNKPTIEGFKAFINNQEPGREVWHRGRVEGRPKGQWCGCAVGDYIVEGTSIELREDYDPEYWLEIDEELDSYLDERNGENYGELQDFLKGALL